ncbi:MAG: hypothetical protein WD851_10050, partial [Pirellulales bacterium]
IPWTYGKRLGENFNGLLELECRRSKMKHNHACHHVYTVDQTTSAWLLSFSANRETAPIALR